MGTTKKATNPRPYVSLTAFWGNDDAESTIKVSRRRWKEIQEGAEYGTSANSWYEGERFSVSWHFADGKVSVFGEDGMECVINRPVAALIVEVVSPSPRDR
ncbi:MAG: hypothetical protein U0900_06620 [Myxococcota bacterium]